MKKLIFAIILLVSFSSFGQSEVDKLNEEVKKTISYLDLDDLDTIYGYKFLGGMTEFEYTEQTKKAQQVIIDYFSDKSDGKILAETILYTYSESEMVLNSKKYSKIYNEQIKPNSYLSKKPDFAQIIIFVSLIDQIQYTRIYFNTLQYFLGLITKEKYEAAIQNSISSVIKTKIKYYK